MNLSRYDIDNPNSFSEYKSLREAGKVIVECNYTCESGETLMRRLWPTQTRMIEGTWMLLGCDVVCPSTGFWTVNEDWYNRVRSEYLKYIYH